MQLLTDQQRKILQGHYLSAEEITSIMVLRTGGEYSVMSANAIDKLLYALMGYQNTLHYALMHEEVAIELLKTQNRVDELEAQRDAFETYLDERVEFSNAFLAENTPSTSRPRVIRAAYRETFQLDETRYEAPPLEDERAE